MCLLTYWPNPEGGFVLTHNRDEAPGRSAPELDTRALGVFTAVFPLDAGAGGTWIGALESGRAAAVLNGAFVKHQRTPPYRKSRGLVMLDFLSETDPVHFFEYYPLEGIEPFTLASFENGEKGFEFRWDGRERRLKNLDARLPHVWSSATLYSPDMQKRREDLFFNQLSRFPSGNMALLLRELHTTGSVGDPENDYVMDRGGRVRTVSMTQIVHENHHIQMLYSDFEHKQSFNRQLYLNKNNV